MKLDPMLVGSDLYMKHFHFPIPSLTFHQTKYILNKNREREGR